VKKHNFEIWKSQKPFGDQFEETFKWTLYVSYVSHYSNISIVVRNPRTIVQTGGTCEY
jgi:hypothetical protein